MKGYEYEQGRMNYKNDRERAGEVALRPLEAFLPGDPWKIKSEVVSQGCP